MHRNGGREREGLLGWNKMFLHKGQILPFEILINFTSYLSRRMVKVAVHGF